MCGRAVSANLDDEVDAFVDPAIGSQCLRVCGGLARVVRMQRLQNHERTSAFVRSSTPRVSWARKNIGRGSLGRLKSMS